MASPTAVISTMIVAVSSAGAVNKQPLQVGLFGDAQPMLGDAGNFCGNGNAASECDSTEESDEMRRMDRV